MVVLIGFINFKMAIFVSSGVEVFGEYAQKQPTTPPLTNPKFNESHIIDSKLTLTVRKWNESMLQHSTQKKKLLTLLAEQ